MATLNVRLRDDDARLVRELKRRGVSISDVVRTALRAELQRGRDVETLDVGDMLAGMLRRYPTPKSAKRRSVNAADRRQVQIAIREKLRLRR